MKVKENDRLHIELKSIQESKMNFSTEDCVLAIKAETEKFRKELEDTKNVLAHISNEKEALKELLTKQKNITTKGEKHLRECQQVRVR